MHTIKVLAAGFLLLVACVLACRLAGYPALGPKLFIPLWGVAAGINMWYGVSRAGYSVADEAPTFLVVFGLPAIVAGFLWWRMARA